jgi:hypothetical protein
MLRPRRALRSSGCTYGCCGPLIPCTLTKLQSRMSLAEPRPCGEESLVAGIYEQAGLWRRSRWAAGVCGATVRVDRELFEEHRDAEEGVGRLPPIA